MAEHTKIEWCDHTFNAWIGCTAVSPACDHCYAETLAKRYGWAKWGPGELRSRTSDANWRKPIAWNKAAAAAGVRRRVFCASLADVFDAEVLQEWRGDLMDLIQATPSLDWLLLTKRPQVAKKFFADRPVPDNVWLGTTVEDQKMADLRIPILLSIDAKVRFLSCEPLLGPLDLYNGDPDPRLGGHKATATYLGDWWEPGDDLKGPSRHGVDWVIAGGESGHGARPPRIEWIRSLRDQCLAAEVAFFFKQWGEFTPDHPAAAHTSMVRVGKKKAGALLDGREHKDFPQ